MNTEATATTAPEILRTVKLPYDVEVTLTAFRGGFLATHRDTDAGETIGTQGYATLEKANEALDALDLDGAFLAAWDRLRADQAAHDAREDSEEPGYQADDVARRLEQIELWLDEAGHRAVHAPATFTAADLAQVKAYAGGTK